MSIEDDPVLGRFFDTPEKKAKWLTRLKYAQLLWIIFIILGILFFFLYFLLQ